MKSHYGRGFDELWREFSSAEKYVWICSPWITPSNFKRIMNISQKGPAVRIITSSDEFNKECLDAMKEYAKKKPKNFQYMIIQRGKGESDDEEYAPGRLLHAKFYLKDDKVAMVGSLNFTETSMHDNIEYLITMEDPKDVLMVKKDFEDLWRYLECDPARGEMYPDSALRNAPKETADENDVEFFSRGMEVGWEFEKHVKSLFPEDEFTILQWTKMEKKADERKGDEDLFDLHIEHKPTGERFFVEAIYRSGLYKNRLSLMKKDKLEQYKRIWEKRRTPIFVIAGLGGTPGKPEAMYCIPLIAMKYPELYPSVFELYDRSVEEPFQWNDRNLD